MSNEIDNLKRQDSDSDDPVDDDEIKQVAEHACDYCLQSNENCVVKCTNKSCERWFCNGTAKEGFGSHIILHLIKSKHREILLHPKNRVGITSVECYVCEQKNIFVLGQVNDCLVKVEGEDNILMICRQPCLQKSEFNNITWDSQEFEPLINEKHIQDWLVQIPNEKMQRNCRQAPVDKINQLEELRKLPQNNKMKFEELTKKDMQQKFLKEVQLTYQDSKHYLSVFQPLIRIEEDYDKKMKESQTQTNITIRWDYSLKKKRQAYFFYSSKEEFDTGQLLGNEMMLTFKQPNYPLWESKGTVVKVVNGDEICLELHSNEPPPSATQGFSVELIWRSTTFKRMQNGLIRFRRQEDSISSYLYYTILGQKSSQTPQTLVTALPQKLSAPNLPELNVYQADACRKALKQPLSLIQGPPGTGKTITSATIVYQLVKAIQKSKSRGQVLVCAPSNIVVDQLADKINQTGLKVVRLCSKMRESVSSNVEPLTLHNQVRSLDLPEYQGLQRLYQLLDEQGELNGKDEQTFIRMRDDAERDVLDSADVICTTCNGSSDGRLKNMKFLYVLIDEATQAIEPECLLPMLKGAKQIILVGDHRQLGPVVSSREAARAGLDRSMFERLIALGIRPVRLQVQYRMHPELTVFPSNTFYEGTLQNGVTVSDRTHTGDFPWPNTSKPMMFLNVCGVEQISASGTSYLNQSEATQVEKILYYLVKSGVRPSQIGIITPYKGQRAYMINFLMKNGSLSLNSYKDIEVASVDGFQGREKDYIIISCVRSNEGQGIGFLTNPRRLNVTITRARYGLIIVGNAKVLSRDNLWNNLLNHFKDHELLMEGTIPHLKLCVLKFKAPQKFIPERRNTSMNDEGEQKNDNLIQFDFDSGEVPLTQGFRKSEFGFNQIPEQSAFIRNEEFGKKKEEINEVDGKVIKFEEEELEQENSCNSFAKFKIKDELKKEELSKQTQIQYIQNLGQLGSDSIEPDF